MDDWPVLPQGHPAIEDALAPAAAGLASPVDRVLRAGLFQPAPTCLAPKGPLPVGSLVHKGGEFGMSHRSAGDPKRSHFYRMGPFFIVENERKVWCRPQPKSSP